MSSPAHSALLDVLDDLFFMLDEDETPLEWNQATVDLTGYEVEELSADFHRL